MHQIFFTRIFLQQDRNQLLILGNHRFSFFFFFFVPGLNSLTNETVSGWEIFTIALSETIGTAILVFIGCAGCIGSLGINPSVLQISLTFGLAVLIAIQVRSLEK